MNSNSVYNTLSYNFQKENFRTNGKMFKLLLLYNQGYNKGYNQGYNKGRIQIGSQGLSL